MPIDAKAKGQLISEWNLVGFLGDLKTPKFHSEMNRPLRFDTLNRFDEGWTD